MLAFAVAGYLIYDSLNDWAESPTVTSLETFPISELPFPEVTVCPPLGSNTALNYDLVTANNITMDNETRNELAKFLKFCYYINLGNFYYNRKLAKFCYFIVC